MLGIEEILCEVERAELNEQGLPPGFRFHPTDEELISFYLASKVFNGNNLCGMEIAEVDLNRCEPWELPDVAKMGEREWYFFSLRDRKYPTGLRTNRATNGGYWKATGKDRHVHSEGGGLLVGMKKTLVFYRGRAPRGQKTKWVMHEYRLDGDFSSRGHTCKEEWVICRIFHKMGDKKVQNMLQCQNYSAKTSSSSFEFPTGNSSLPPLLEPLPTLLESQPHRHQDSSMIQTLNQNQNPFLFQSQESDLKSLISPPVASQCDIFAVNSFSQTLITDSNMVNGTVHFKPFLSNQDLSLQELNSIIAKQCKKEAGSINDHHFQLLSGNMHWPENNQDNTTTTSKYQNPFLSGMNSAGDIGLIISSAATGDNVGTLDGANFNYVMSNEQFPRWWQI